jgi:hypothetical protein
MATFKKKQLDELVGGDIYSVGGDRNQVNNSEIETGPYDKSYDDDSYYEKNVSTTTDRVFARYRQNIPWFAVYSFGGSRTGGLTINYGTFAENSNSTIIKKKTVEEKIEDLVKRSKSSDVTSKDYNPKVEKVMDEINDLDLTDTQIEELLKAINDKKNNPKTNKNL